MYDFAVFIDLGIGHGQTTAKNQDVLTLFIAVLLGVSNDLRVVALPAARVILPSGFDLELR
jgi:hypothetical protein